MSEPAPDEDDAAAASMLEVALLAAGSGVYDWAVQAGSVRWSESLEQMHGLEVGSFGGSFSDFVATVHPEDRDDVAARVNDILAGGAPGFVFEFRSIRPDGGFGHVESRGRVVRDATGRAIRVIGVASDVTTRVVQRRQLEQLRRIGAALSAVQLPDDVLATLADEFAETDVEIRWRPTTPAVGPLFATEVAGDRLELVGRASGMSRRQAIAIGDLAAGAMERALRHEADRRNASVLQRALAPEPGLDVAGWSFDAAYLPATDADRLGGDFLDLLQLDDAVVVTIGDVTGHGLAATRQMANVRTMLRTLAALNDGDPAITIASARRLFAAVSGTDLRLASAMVVRIHIATGRVELVSAGHPAPIVATGRAMPSIRRLTPRPLLGLDDPGEVRTEQFTLGSGDWIGCYTDGVFESRSVPLVDAVEAACARVDVGSVTALDLLGLGDAIPDRTVDDRAIVVIRREPST